MFYVNAEIILASPSHHMRKIQRKKSGVEGQHMNFEAEAVYWSLTMYIK